MANLLPCPFCGGKAKQSYVGVRHIVFCQQCDISIRQRETAIEAVAAWNQRDGSCWCGECKYYTAYSGVCTNPDSDYRADARSEFDSCEHCERG